MVTYGTRLKGTLTKIPKNRELNTGEYIKTVVETTQHNPSHITPKVWLEELQKELRISEPTVKIHYINVMYVNTQRHLLYTDQYGVSHYSITAQLRAEIHYEIMSNTPIAPLIIVAAIIIIAAAIAAIIVIVIVRETHWLIAKAIEVAEDVAEDVKEGLENLGNTFFGEDSPLGETFGSLGSAGALVIPLILIAILILGSLLVVYTIAKKPPKVSL